MVRLTAGRNRGSLNLRKVSHPQQESRPRCLALRCALHEWYFCADNGLRGVALTRTDFDTCQQVVEVEAGYLSASGSARGQNGW